GRQWEALLRRPNVRYLGQCGLEELRRTLASATVGLVPFARNESISERSFPLKVFEYIAGGLPVVSTPLRELQSWKSLIAFADNADDFTWAIRAARQLRHCPRLLAQRDEAARAQSYDAKFATVSHALREMVSAYPRVAAPLNVLVLYDAGSLHVKTIEHHLRSFSLYSRNRVSYASATGQA